MNFSRIFILFGGFAGLLLCCLAGLVMYIINSLVTTIMSNWKSRDICHGRMPISGLSLVWRTYEFDRNVQAWIGNTYNRLSIADVYLNKQHTYPCEIQIKLIIYFTKPWNDRMTTIYNFTIAIFYSINYGFDSTKY